MKPIISCFIVTSVLLFNTGCAAVLVGAGAAGTVAYVKGDFESTEPYSVPEVYAAAQQALAELGLARISESQDHLSARIIARTAQDKKITIKIAYVTENSSQLSIRVAIFGSEEKSRQIYLKIREHLEAG